MTKNLLNNPYFLLMFCIFTIFLNTVLSSHFILLTFSGFIFLMFYVALKNRYYYSLMAVIITFTLLEYNMGLQLFTLSLISLFIYVFILPTVNRINAFSKINKYVHIIIFYGFLHIAWGLQTNFTDVLFFSLLANLVVDAFLLGVLI